MAADEYYDAIGEVLSYALSAEDFIVGQEAVADGNYFTIQRDNSIIRFYATTTRRYFPLIYEFSLLDRFIRVYEKDNTVLNNHMEEYCIEGSLHDENLNQIVAYERVSDISKGDAKRVVNDIMSFVIHSDCRVRSLTRENPKESKEDEIWDGIRTIGLLYPYEENFKPRDYENVAQEVISVGTQIEEQLIKKLGLEEELETPSEFLSF